MGPCSVCVCCLLSTPRPVLWQTLVFWEWMDLSWPLSCAVHPTRSWEEVIQPGPLSKGKGPGPIQTARRREAPAEEVRGCLPEDGGQDKRRGGYESRQHWSAWGGQDSSTWCVGKGVLGSACQGVNPAPACSSLCDLGKSLTLSEPRMYHGNSNRTDLGVVVLGLKCDNTTAGNP